MKKHIRKIVIGVPILAFVTLAWLGLSFKMPAFAGIERIEFGELRGKNLSAEIAARVYNPNFYSLSATDIRYVIAYHDTVIGKGELPSGLKLEGGDTSSLLLPAEMDLGGIFAVYKSMLSEKRSPIKVRLDGNFTFLQYPYGFDLLNDVSGDSLMGSLINGAFSSNPINFRDIKWKSTSVSSSEFSFVSSVKNPLSLPFSIQTIELDFSEEGHHKAVCGHWKLEKAVELRPNSSTSVPGTVHVKHAGAGKGVVKGVFKGEIRYYVWGTLRLLLADLPFDIPIEGAFVLRPLTGDVRWEN